jgi:hypothetical protein
LKIGETYLGPETRNTRPPVSLLLCDNLKNRMFFQNFFCLGPCIQLKISALIVQNPSYQ